MALHVNGSTLYVGGRYNKFGATVRNRIAAFDTGTGVLTVWNPNASGDVGAIATDGPSNSTPAERTSAGATRSRPVRLNARVECPKLATIAKLPRTGW